MAIKFKNSNAEIFVPDNRPIEESLNRTTQISISAHQDDLEIMAYQGILQCFGKEKDWFFGVVVSNGSGSPRDDLYAGYSDEDMRKVRKTEQKKAAVVGEYSGVALLDYPTSIVKDASKTDVKDDIKTLISAAKPKIVYTHNLADKHDTHVAVCLRTIQALREIDYKPEKVYGCEVWRDLDWMIDEDKVAFDVAAHENLAMALLGVFDSQICGGKRYDLATQGRRRANATYFASHGTDNTTALAFAMDLTPLINNPGLNPEEYVLKYINRFTDEVKNRLNKLQK